MLRERLRNATLKSWILRKTHMGWGEEGGANNDKPRLNIHHWRNCSHYNLRHPTSPKDNDKLDGYGPGL